MRSHKKVKIKFFETQGNANDLELLEAIVADLEIFYKIQFDRDLKSRSAQSL
jgi:hypothetical protein